MLWKSFGCALGIGALAIGTMTVACGVPGTDPSGVGDPQIMAASDATRSAIGVTTWGFRVTSPSTLSVRGYDEGDRQVVEVRQRLTATDAYHWALDFGVASETSTSTLHFTLASRAVAGGVEVDGRVTSDTVRSNAMARKIIDRLRADAKVARASANRNGVSVDTSSLQPMDLTSGGGGDIASDEGDGVASGSDDRLTSDGQDAGQGGGSGNDESESSDSSCQSSEPCGGDMMDGLEPVLDMLSSAGQGLSSFVALYACMNADAGGADAGASPSPVVLPEIVTCALEQYQGSGGESPQPGGSDDSPLTSLLGAFSSMQSMGQSCNCPQ